jgi:FixJ family two-component response regulator
MREEKPIIFVVDDDPSVRDSMVLMLKSEGFNVKTFVSAQDFLNANLQQGPACLILDVRMPGMSGLDLQEKLVSAKTPLPVIFITGHGTVPMSVRAMKAGAVDFLQKPFEEQDLLDAIYKAINLQKERKSKTDEAGQIQQRVNALTPREYEVFSLLVTGMPNKEIAYKLGTSERTVKAHRAQIMQKTNAGSLADLVRFAEKLKTHPPDH